MATTIFPRRRYYNSILNDPPTGPFARPIIQLQAGDILEYVELGVWLFSFAIDDLPPVETTILYTFLKFTFAPIGSSPPSPGPAIPAAEDTIEYQLLTYRSTAVESGRAHSAKSEMRANDTLVFPSQNATLWYCMNNSFAFDHPMRQWAASGWAYAEYRSLTEIPPP